MKPLSRAAQAARILALAVYTFATLSIPGVAKAAPTLPNGYSLTQLTSGLNLPTNMAWLPDGTMLISEKSGLVKTFKNGAIGAQPMVDLTSTTNDYWDHGLLGIAVDPDYTNNHYLYLLHTYENNKADHTGTKVNQLVRVTIDPATNQSVTGSETVLLGTQVAATCENLPVTADCMPSDSPSHSVGDVVFASDGTLFVTSGDGSSFNFADDLALRAQDTNRLNGKILHIDKNGKGLSTNPFYTGNVSDNKSKVWAYGLRNPWRFGIKPGTSVPYITDVGWSTYEEINVATPGANFGWPCYEGPSQQPDYSGKAGCQDLYSKVQAGTTTVTAPLIYTTHNGQQSAITGGAWVTGANYPASLQGSYLYGDYAQNTASTLRTDASHQLTSGPAAFGNNVSTPVDFEQGPDGYIYVVSISDAAGNLNTGQIFRLDYTAPPPPGQCSAGQFSAQYFNTVNLSGTLALEQCEAAPIDHNWGMGSPDPKVNVDSWSARYTGTFAFNAGTYQFSAGADDGVRVMVDGATVVDGWKDQSFTNYTGSTTLSAGNHTVVVEYFDSAYDAALKVNWTQTANPDGSCSTGQFKAEYFNGINPGATPALVTQCEAAPINHNWGMGSPDPKINVDNWSARYTGSFNFNAGDYTFTSSADDGTRIILDGTIIVNGWKDQSTTTYTATKTLTAGVHTVEVDYYDSGWDANLTADWKAVVNQPPAVTLANPADGSYYLPGIDTVNFSGSAVDPEDGKLAASSLAWNAVIKHCVGGSCHNHFLQSWNGVASGSFTFPDHGADDYHIELTLTATDSKGAQSSKTVILNPNRNVCAADRWSVSYWNNKTLTGTPVATDCIDTINYNWGMTSPKPGVNTQNWSARFTTTKMFVAGNYKFTLTGDDGIRMFIDGTLFITGWKDQSATTYTKQKLLTAGAHTIKVEYYNSTWNATAKASWTKL